MEFIRPLVESLIQQDPKARPSASQALARFESRCLCGKVIRCVGGYENVEREDGQETLERYGSISQEVLFIASTIA